MTWAMTQVTVVHFIVRAFALELIRAPEACVVYIQSLARPIRHVQVPVYAIQIQLAQPADTNVRTLAQEAKDNIDVTLQATAIDSGNGLAHHCAIHLPALAVVVRIYVRQIVVQLVMQVLEGVELTVLA